MSTIDLSGIPTPGRQVLRVAEQLSGLVGNPKYGICVNRSTLSALFVSGDGSIFVRADIDIDEQVEEFNLYFERLLDSNMNAVEVFEHSVFSSIELVSPLIKKLETFDEYFTFTGSTDIPKLNPSCGEIRVFDVPSGDVRLGFDGRTFLLNGEEVYATFNLSLESVSFDVVVDGTILNQLADKGELRISFSPNWLNVECLMLGGVIRGMMAYQEEEEPEEDNIVHFPTPEPESEPEPEVVWGGHPLLPMELAERMPYLGNADEEAIMQVRYHYPPTGWEWYASEFDPSSKKFFGFVFGDFDEWGYFSLDELYRNQVLLDREFAPKTLKEIQAIKSLAEKMESEVTFADNSSPTPPPNPTQPSPPPVPTAVTDVLWLDTVSRLWQAFEKGEIFEDELPSMIRRRVPGLDDLQMPVDSWQALTNAISNHLKPQMALRPLSADQQQELFEFLMSKTGGDRFLEWFEPAKKPARKARKSAAAAMPSSPSLRVPVETVQRGSRQEALLLFLRQGRTGKELADKFGAYSARIAEIRKKGYEIKFIDDKFYFEGDIVYA